jgi:hypothetical protein
MHVPSPLQLSLDGLRLRSNLQEIVLDAAKESCVGETVAALALSRAAESCGSEELRTRLQAMADEELSHAAFGFRIVAWAFKQLGEAAREELRNTLRVHTYEAPSVDEQGDAWRELGRLTSADLRKVEQEARMLIAAAKDELFKPVAWTTPTSTSTSTSTSTPTSTPTPSGSTARGCGLRRGAGSRAS